MKIAAAALAFGMAAAVQLSLAGQRLPARSAEKPLPPDKDPGYVWPMEDSRNPDAQELYVALEIAATGSKSPRDDAVVARNTRQRRSAIRALGRLARRESITPLLALVSDRRVGRDAEEALVVTLRAHA